MGDGHNDAFVPDAFISRLSPLNVCTYARRTL